MKGLFWNVGGLGAYVRKRFVRELIMDRHLDFLGLLETMKANFSKNDLSGLCGGKNFSWHWSPSRGRSGRILVGINNDVFEVLETEIGDYFVRVLVYDKIAKFRWNLITVYGDAQPERKALFLSELSQVYHDNTLSCLAGGDFNIIRKDTEKNKPNNTKLQCFVFNAIIEHAGLREQPLNGTMFTRGNNLDDPTFEKVDRVLFCPDWEDNVGNMP